MKILFTFYILLITASLYSQYNYGLDICDQDVKIEGKLNLSDGFENLFIGNNSGINIQPDISTPSWVGHSNTL